MARMKLLALVAVGVVVAASCTPASGLPTRQFRLDDYCTLEVRIVEDGGSSYVAARKFGVQWVDGEITGGQSQGCGTWVMARLEAQTTEGTSSCRWFFGDGPSQPPGPGCTGYAPDWYQLAAPGELIEATAHLCKTATPYAPYDCAGIPGGIVVYP